MCSAIHIFSRPVTAHGKRQHYNQRRVRTRGGFSMTPQQHCRGFFWRVLCLAALSSCFGETAAAQTAPRPSLTVTPSSPIDISGPHGGPFSPASFRYHLSASTGTIRFAISPPFWLTADPRVGTVSVNGVTVTLSVSPQGLKLPARAYTAPVTLTNVTNGQGSTSRTAKLIVQPSATPSQGYLLDEKGGNLRDHRGERLIGR